MDECRRRIGETVTYATDMYDAAVGCDALMLVTEWKEFRMPNVDTLLHKIKNPATTGCRKCGILHIDNSLSL